MVKPTTSCILEDKDKILLNEFMDSIGVTLTIEQYNNLYECVEKLIITAYNMGKGRK